MSSSISTSTHAGTALVRGSSDCVKVLDLQGRLEFVNPGGVMSLELESPGSLLGEVWWNMWPEEGSIIAEKTFQAALKGSVCEFTGACPTAKGNLRWWDVTASPIRDANGGIENILVVSRDITELVAAQDELRANVRRKDEILETVAHEIRNPLAAALAATQLLTLRKGSPEEVARLALVITRQLGHMTRMAEDLIDSARVGRGELKISKGAVDLNDVVEIAVEQLRAALMNKNQELNISLCEGQCATQGDEVRLVQAVGNLIANAIRYTPMGGRVEVHVARVGATAEISVSDSGIGIAPERAEQLFDRYTRVSSDSDRASAGLGLGLSLVKAIVELHDGTVSFVSKGLGMGSTFTIAVPLYNVSSDRLWTVKYKTPDGYVGSLSRYFDKTPDRATAAFSIKDALLPRRMPLFGNEADTALLAFKLLNGLGYKIIDIRPQR